MPSYQNILVVQLRQVGDVLLTGPLIHSLRLAFPESRIDLLVERYSAEAGRGIPWVDEVLPVDRKLSPHSLWRLMKQLRSRRYDLVVDSQSNQKTGFLTWLTGAARRVGFAQPWYKLYHHMFHTDRVPRDPSPKYSASYRMDLLAPLNVATAGTDLGYEVPPEAAEYGRRILTQAGQGARPIVGLSPGGRVDWKNWPVEQFQELGRRILSRGMSVVVLKGPGEEEIAGALHAELGEGAYLEEAPSYVHHAGIVSGLSAAVLNDGGNLHLAVALGVPTVTVFGPTDPRIWAAPDTRNHRVLRSPCRCSTGAEVLSCLPRRCLVGTGVEEVFAELEDLLDDDRRARD